MKAGDPQRQQGAGWLFVTPAIIVLGLFLVAPIFMALWVSVSDWTGRGSPFSGETNFVGLDNYSELLAEPAARDAMVTAALRLARPDAAERIARRVLDIAEGGV